ncbi:hypothetical protein [Streptomyces sp. CL12-4]|uniref:hypothetical protein n=1 Tax=Streptomyces sp. CL12-4 TaxID=2810306 RepID=UPI001EFAEA95|nr:hypothetical protein [Streptomyces sp. CL12-4]MCG8968817.1 hypothetical protein [Streptomyces sp. CL12-4]
MGLDHASLTSLAALGEATRRRMFELLRHERRLTRSIEEFGHEPERTAPTLMRLRNGPFHPMAAKAPELICAVKQISGWLLARLGSEKTTAVLAPRLRSCCVECAGTARRATDRRGAAPASGEPSRCLPFGVAGSPADPLSAHEQLESP